MSCWFPASVYVAQNFLLPSPRHRSSPSLQCTPSCGPGYRHRVVLCKSGESGDTLPESKCPKHSRPTSRVRCNLKRCPPPQWVTGPWGEVRGALVLYTGRIFKHLSVHFWTFDSFQSSCVYVCVCVSVLPNVVWVRKCVQCSV